MRLLLHWRLKPWTFALLIVLLLILISATAFAYIEVQRPQISVIPRPTGPYAVGRMEYDWSDQSRTDSLAPKAGTKRELVIWAWYPARRTASATLVPYMPPKWQQLSDQQHQSSGTVQTNSIAAPPLAPGTARYPVLIFEPGMGNSPLEYTTMMEDLASHGYVIFAITPTYSSNVVVFPDGRVANATPAGKLESVEKQQSATNRLVQIWSQDVAFVMDQLGRLNAAPGNLWSQRLDLAHFGVFGHSFGGATAAQVCLIDARCNAGINLDGDMAGDVVQKGLTTPFMVIQHDMGTCSDAECRTFQHDVHALLHRIPRGAGYHLSIQGTEHFNFSDYAVLSESQSLRALGLLGSIDGLRGLQIVRAYTRAFFDRYLKKIPSPLLQGPSSVYPEGQFIAP
ncbi:alpha/beta hydrolase family protein [Dictyobacter aurantiacus]|uniref:Alpha/beta hydrolase n=1 Tax=Dictyobacter aurantiacus TaxID=1936993 RepID=A0A401ZH07_9CHLR|nr:hypothetical protein [Dictyobacter aurantiacus]GCE06174.1 alpha/beta hydrolase [Dictyobacter aurantiacus]